MAARRATPPGKPAVKAGKPKARSKSKGGLLVDVVRLAHAEGLDLPAYQTAGAAGLDLVAAVPESEPRRLEPMQRALVPTGLVLELPHGIEGQIRPRSGLALRHGITVLNSPGTIDSDYRGEVQVLLINLGAQAWEIERGERIAQLVLARVEQASLVITVKLGDTARGAGGFGSTGTAKRAAVSGAERLVAKKVARTAARTASGKKGKLFQRGRP